MHPTVFSERALGKLKVGLLPSDNARWPKPHNCVMRPPSFFSAVDGEADDKRTLFVRPFQPVVNYFDTADFDGVLEEE